MPGFAGIVDLSGPTPEVEVARRLLARLAGPAERIVSGTRPGAALAHAALPLPTDQGGVASAGDRLLVVHGWIAPAPGEQTRLGDETDKDPGGSPDLAARCLALYRRGGPEALAGLNGVYALALWDARERRLVLAQDRLGLHGLAYRVSAGRVSFATRARAVLDDRAPELDGRALGQLLAVGYVMEDRTLFRDVRVLGPGDLAVWHDRRLLVKRVWSLPIAAPQTPAGEHGIDSLDQALRGAVGDACRGLGDDLRLVLPLSGGLDSRALLGYARHQRNLFTFSYGHAHSWDRRFGRRLAEVAGTRHRPVMLGRDFMARLGARLVYLTDGQASLHAAHPLCLHPEIARRPSVCMSGFLGDALTGAHLDWIAAAPELRDVTEQGRELFERRYRVGFDDATMAGLLRRPYWKEAQGAALEAFLSVYRRGEDPLSRADRVDLEIRQHRFVAYQLALFGAVAPVRAPFADHRVMDTCLHWPAAWRREQRLYRRLLTRIHPDLARVPVTATGVPLAGPGWWLAWRRGVEHFRRRLVPRWSRGWIRPHDYRQYAHYDEWIRTGARRFFTDLLDDRELLGEVFDTERVADLLKLHLDGRIDAFQELTAVATAGLWMRLFMRGSAGMTAVDPPGGAALVS